MDTPPPARSHPDLTGQGSAGFGVVPDSEAAPCCAANIPAKKPIPFTALTGGVPGSKAPGIPTGNPPGWPARPLLFIYPCLGRSPPARAAIRLLPRLGISPP